LFSILWFHPTVFLHFTEQINDDDDFGDDPITDTHASFHSFSTVDQGILENLFAFLIQSLAAFYETRRND